MNMFLDILVMTVLLLVLVLLYILVQICEVGSFLKRLYFKAKTFFKPRVQRTNIQRTDTQTTLNELFRETYGPSITEILRQQEEARRQLEMQQAAMVAAQAQLRTNPSGFFNSIGVTSDSLFGNYSGQTINSQSGILTQQMVQQAAAQAAQNSGQPERDYTQSISGNFIASPRHQSVIQNITIDNSWNGSSYIAPFGRYEPVEQSINVYIIQETGYYTIDGTMQYYNEGDVVTFQHHCEMISYEDQNKLKDIVAMLETNNEYECVKTMSTK